MPPTIESYSDFAQALASGPGIAGAPAAFDAVTVPPEWAELPALTVHPQGGRYAFALQFRCPDAERQTVTVEARAGGISIAQAQCCAEPGDAVAHSAAFDYHGITPLTFFWRVGEGETPLAVSRRQLLIVKA